MTHETVTGNLFLSPQVFFLSNPNGSATIGHHWKTTDWVLLCAQLLSAKKDLGKVITVA